MNSPVIDVVIVGAGPYGLSIAAHLNKKKVSYRIFGRPMQSWQTMMPKGMLLKSDGFASSLYDPDGAFTLRHYCDETRQPYADVGIPVPVDTFTSYGLEFQKRMVPHLEPVNVASVRRVPQGFEVKTETGEKVLARRVVVAAGITHFAWLPPELASLPREFVTHSSAYGDLSPFKGRRVAVLGAGASAVDIAAILQDEGAEAEIVARRKAITFHDPPNEPRPLMERLTKPRSGLGLGWRSRLCTDAPLVFHAMPQDFRFRVVRRHLGPAPGWFVKEKVVGRVPLHMSTELMQAEVKGNQVHLKIGSNGDAKELVVDHVIAGTGYRVSLQRLKFLDDTLRHEIHAIEDTPVLNRSFESSVPGLYFVGVASANSFGPLTRFAYGAMYTAKRISGHLAASKG
ncbi:NAD(P)-binding domain-containing protein [Paracidobacterium acidisoli]|uniref:NAD(P)/FAD-dependent oxidoreductase n=1 Tax=Paracidobacterium acidisoli TaxID=2303751 RepID=A0A372ISJ3_9BACT|nr:NAD(P)-binding domain-containing protein [Paracidobacterium acidisoli]